MTKVRLRIAGLVLVAAGVLAALTVYLSTEKVPPCLVAGAPTWKAPSDDALHRFEVVFPDRAACFYDMDRDHALVGALKLPGAKGIEAVAPRGSSIAIRSLGGDFLLDPATGAVRPGGPPPPAPVGSLLVLDRERRVAYSTEPGRLGFRVDDISTGHGLRFVGFKGFTWNPRFGPNPPSHGLSLAPDRPELWVLDAPNSTVHIFDVSAVPREAPRPIDDIRLTKPLSGDESPCSHACKRIGSLQHSADGRFVYVGDSGAVIDVEKRKEVANLEALHNSRVHLEMAWVDGKPTFPNRPAFP